MSAEPNDYAAKVAEAEAAVKSVTDSELRRVAFEKILQHLLAGAGVDAPAPMKKSVAKSRSKGTRSTRRAAGAGGGPKARLAAMVEEGFFKKQRSIADVKAELANRGFHIPMEKLSTPLLRLTKERTLRRQKIAANGKGSKATWAYSNW